MEKKFAISKLLIEMIRKFLKETKQGKKLSVICVEGYRRRDVRGHDIQIALSNIPEKKFQVSYEPFAVRNNENVKLVEKILYELKVDMLIMTPDEWKEFGKVTKDSFKKYKKGEDQDLDEFKLIMSE